MKAVSCISPPGFEAQYLATLRDALDRDGFVVVPAALNDEWVARLHRAFEVAPVPPSGTQHVTITDTTPEVESWRALERHPLFSAGAHHVLGPSYRVAEVHGRNPLPGFGQQGLHADDLPRAPGEPYSVFTTLWMLDDFTPENGATRVVPRSHLSPHPPAKSVAQPHAHHPDEHITVGRAGSVLIMNGHLWHSGRRNDSTGPRRCVQMLARRLRS